MLEYKLDDNGDYIIIEKMMSFTSTKVMIVTYRKDLSESHVNSDPWRPVCESSRVWFEKHYRKHFDKLARTKKFSYLEDNG